MMRATKKWDTTRPFSANQNQLPPSGAPEYNNTLKYLSAYLDVEGFSHGSIAKDGATNIYNTYPEKNFISSECCSCQTQRGEDTSNRTLGLTYPHTLSQSECMQRCEFVIQIQLHA
jgi:hypothetical protein